MMAPVYVLLGGQSGVATVSGDSLAQHYQRPRVFPQQLSCYVPWKHGLRHTSENGLNLCVAWLWMGLVVLDDALQGTVDESAEPLTDFPEDFPLTYELAEALHRMTFQVPTLSL